MTIGLYIFLILFLFVILGFSANVSVKNIKYIGSVFRIRLFVFGILLGLVTALPEFFLGINATIENVSALSVGNLLGNPIVILGLILGVSLLFNQNVKTDSQLNSLIPTIVVIFSPVLLGLDGSYSFYDGLIMIFLYLALIVYLFYINKSGNHRHIRITNDRKISKAIIFSIAGVGGILVSSHLIMKITLVLLESFNINHLALGFLVFSIGTNLPEISIAVMSWKKKTAELSLSHLLSSAMSSVLILGTLAVIKPIFFTPDLTFLTVGAFSFLTLCSFAYFYHSDKKMSRYEGLALLTVYSVFVFINLFFLKAV